MALFSSFENEDYLLRILLLPEVFKLIIASTTNMDDPVKPMLMLISVAFSDKNIEKTKEAKNYFSILRCCFDSVKFC